MAGEAYVTRLSRHGRSSKMANPSAQDLRRIALKNDGFECEPRYLNLANSLTNLGQVRLNDRDLMRKFMELNRLIGSGVHNVVTRITDCE
jgi:hypothetical protein